MVMVRPGPGSRWGWGGQALPDPPLCAAAASPRATEASTPQNSGSRYGSPTGCVHGHDRLLLLAGHWDRAGRCSVLYLRRGEGGDLTADMYLLAVLLSSTSAIHFYHLAAPSPHSADLQAL